MYSLSLSVSLSLSASVCARVTHSLLCPFASLYLTRAQGDEDDDDGPAGRAVQQSDFEKGKHNPVCVCVRARLFCVCLTRCVCLDNRGGCFQRGGHAEVRSPPLCLPCTFFPSFSDRHDAPVSGSTSRTGIVCCWAKVRLLCLLHLCVCVCVCVCVCECLCLSSSFCLSLSLTQGIWSSLLTKGIQVVAAIGIAFLTWCSPPLPLPPSLPPSLPP